MESFLSVIKGLDWSAPLELILPIIPALICITLHELSHGYVAYLLGDCTAKNCGRLTLNPIKHIDIFGLIMMIVFKFGWAKPVPVNMNNFKNPKRGMAITALAGPVSNILIGCVFLFVYGLINYACLASGSDVSMTVLSMVYMTSYMSFALAVFNILPIPPLDGSKILFSVISDKAYYKLMRYEQIGMVLLLVLVATDFIGDPLVTAVTFLMDKLFVFAQWGAELSWLLM